MADRMRQSCSDAGIWTQCPGYLALAREAPEPPANEYMVRGSLIHGVWYLSRATHLDPGDLTDDVDVELCARSMNNYLDGLIGREHLEQKLGPLPPELPEDFGGTPDAVVIDGDTAHVVDLKTGMTAVPADSPQLRCYGLLTAHAHPHVKTIVLHVVQPLVCDVPEVVELTSAEIKKFAFVVWDARIRTEFHVGHQCRWCKVRGHCPEFFRTMAADIDANTASINLDECARIYTLWPAYKEAYEDIRTKLTEAMLKGQEFAGLKLVRSEGHRQWAHPEAETLQKLKSLGIAKVWALDSKLRSPAGIERIAKAKGKLIDLSDLASQPHEGRLVVALASHRSKGVDPKEHHAATAAQIVDSFPDLP